MRGDGPLRSTAITSVSKETRTMNVAVKHSQRPSRLRMLAMVVASTFAVALFCAPAAMAEFNFKYFDIEMTNADGSPAMQAGSHPFALTARSELNFSEIGPGKYFPDGQLKDLLAGQVAGLVGDATANPQCKSEDFLTNNPSTGGRMCPNNTAVGRHMAQLLFPGQWVGGSVYSLVPPHGVAVRLGFHVLQVNVIFDVIVNERPPYNVIGRFSNVSQAIPLLGAVLQLWGDPTAPAYDEIRGDCSAFMGDFGPTSETLQFPSGGPGTCPVERGKPFLTLPTSCSGPAESTYEMASWEDPGRWVGGATFTHDDVIPPNPMGFTGCGIVSFKPAVSATPSSASVESPTGLDFRLSFAQDGLTNGDGISQSTVKKVVATLPKGVTINPSVGEGLGFCSPAEYAREGLATVPGSACPNESKIGTAEVETPLLGTPVDGSLYLAQQGDPDTAFKENPFDSLIALYIVLREPKNSIFIKIPLKVEPDPTTGQLVTTAEDLPQLPFSHFNLHFREGKRSPLSTPPACGSYDTVTQLYPWSDPGNPVTSVASFEITGGIGGGDCPPGGVPPFNPDFEAGSINNNAGSYSEFDMRLIRHDGEQDMTKFGSILPPGVVGNLSGVAKCSDADIATARGKTGREEQASPSCPASSQIGRTLAGAGVGPALTYVPGKVYLGGPYRGDPLSVVSVTPAVSGPFDAGDVVVQIALNLDPKTAEVIVDGSKSDAIPHILKGIPLKVRDLRVYIDRQNFIVNPTSCDESSAKATLFGANLDLFSDGDDVPVDLSTRYQAANCLNLGFSPHLGLHLKGGTRRGAYPGLKAVYSPKSGDANISGLVVRLPRSAFLEQGHIRTICTRVQFAAKSCPAAARYGYVKAWTPLLDEPLQGPVWLRSSSHKLPDMVFDLHGLVDVEVATRIDSVKGGIRATVEDAPDAPLSRVILKMQGGKKGLIVNSRNICVKRGRNRANALGLGQNGKQFKSRPLMQVRCANKRSHKSHRRARVARASLAG